MPAIDPAVGPPSLSVDPASPDAILEHGFFRSGLEPEGPGSEEPAVEEPRRPPSPLRRWAALAAAGLAALGGGLVLLGRARPAPLVQLPPSPLSGLPAAAPPPPPVETPARGPALLSPTAGLVFGALEIACRHDTGRHHLVSALESCARALDLRPDAAELALLVAREALERGRPDHARSWAERARAIDPTLAEAYLLIGGASQQSGLVQEARSEYGKYLELVPSGGHASDLRVILRRL